MPQAPLAGLQVLVTRPAHQAAGLVLKLEDAGAGVSTLPLLAIAPPQDADAARAALRDGAHADLWIFTSANAVEGVLALHHGQWPSAPKALFALGQGSVRALARHGQHAVAPEGGSSEDLLLWPELADLRGKHVLIVTGEGGRAVLAQTLSARGAVVTLARCYRRERIAHAVGHAAALVQAAQVLVLTSGEALDALLSLAAAGGWSLHDKALLLPSMRVAQAARRFATVGPLLLPAAVSDTAIVRRLEQWQRAPHNDCP